MKVEQEHGTYPGVAGCAAKISKQLVGYMTRVIHTAVDVPHFIELTIHGAHAKPLNTSAFKVAVVQNHWKPHREVIVSVSLKTTGITKI